MRSKDILLAYINTLDDKECKKIYLMLRELEGAKDKYEFYDHEAKRSDTGLIKLTPKQYCALYNKWGDEKTRYCFGILTKYLLKTNNKNKASHFSMLNGWVETQFIRKFTHRGRPANVIPVSFNEIQSKAQARVYVAQVPANARSSDLYVTYLVNRWGADILPGFQEETIRKNSINKNRILEAIEKNDY